MKENVARAAALHAESDLNGVEHTPLRVPSLFTSRNSSPHKNIRSLCIYIHTCTSLLGRPFGNIYISAVDNDQFPRAIFSPSAGGVLIRHNEGKDPKEEETEGRHIYIEKIYSLERINPMGYIRTMGTLFLNVSRCSILRLGCSRC